MQDNMAELENHKAVRLALMTASAQFCAALALRAHLRSASRNYCHVIAWQLKSAEGHSPKGISRSSPRNAARNCRFPDRRRHMASKGPEQLTQGWHLLRPSC